MNIKYKNTCSFCNNEQQSNYYFTNFRCIDCTYEITTKRSYQGLQNIIYDNK